MFGQTIEKQKPKQLENHTKPLQKSTIPDCHRPSQKIALQNLTN